MPRAFGISSTASVTPLGADGVDGVGGEVFGSKRRKTAGWYLEDRAPVSNPHLLSNKKTFGRGPTTRSLGVEH